MSRATVWAWAIKGLGCQTKMVLLALAERANHATYECFPSQATIAEDAEVSVKTVKRAVERLVKVGAITVLRSRRADGRLGGNIYRLNVDVSVTLPDGSVKRESATGLTDPLATGLTDPSLTSPTSEHDISFTLTSETTLQPQCVKEISSRQREKIIRKTPWKDGDEIPDGWVEWAKRDRLWTTSETKLEAQRFIDNNLANRRLYADWFAAWRNWCRSPYCKTEKGKPSAPKQPVRIDRW